MYEFLPCIPAVRRRTLYIFVFEHERVQRLFEAFSVLIEVLVRVLWHQTNDLIVIELQLDRRICAIVSSAELFPIGACCVQIIEHIREWRIGVPQVFHELSLLIVTHCSKRDFVDLLWVFFNALVSFPRQVSIEKFKGDIYQAYQIIDLGRPALNQMVERREDEIASKALSVADLLLLRQFATHSEVNESKLQFVVGIYLGTDVLQLEVAVRVPQAVQLPKGWCHLANHFAGESLPKALIPESPLPNCKLIPSMLH